MSRNIRQKFPRAPVKQTKRRGSDSSSSLDLSDDEGYSGVDEVSDSEDDDEEHVDAAEEEHFIFRAARKGVAGSPRPGQDEEAEEDEEEEEDEEGDNDDDDEMDDDELAEEGDEEDGGDSASWDGILSDIDGADANPSPSDFIPDQDAVSVERHVRFAGVPDSDSESTASDTTEDIHEFFPDIFVEQSALDPAFRREIEIDPDDSSNSGSFWDFQNAYEPFGADSDEEAVVQQASDDETPTSTPAASRAVTEVSTPVPSDEAQELDGYETDGDTTEEDIPEPQPRKKQARRYPSADRTSDSDTERPVRFRRGQPRVGRFNLDSSEKKPIAVVNPISRKMMIFTPQKLRRLDLSPESFNLQFFNDANMAQSSPILSNSASLMMSAMFSSNTFGDFMNTQPVGPAEAFFSFASDGVMADDSDDSGDVDADEDELERNLELEDFITFHQHESDDDEEERVVELGDWDNDGTVEPSSTPVRPRTSASAVSDITSPDVHPLLSHFDNNANAVGAFRRNQVNQQLIMSDRATHESLAFSNPYHHGTLRGIKNGSFETVTTPITPARRQKRNSVSFAGLSSPLESVAQKRKASNGIGGANHKRHRSISEMEVLQI